MNWHDKFNNYIKIHALRTWSEAFRGCQKDGIKTSFSYRRKEAEHYRGLQKKYEALFLHDNKDIRAIGELLVKDCKERIERALEREHYEDVHGY